MHQNTKMNMLCYQEFICDYCDRSFSRKYNLRVHIENCHLNSDTCCDICGVGFGSLAGLLQHLSRGHNSQGLGFPECHLCGRFFKRRQNIISHMVTIHLNAVDIRCKICNKTYTTQRNLKRHEYQIHNPDFQHLQCDECKKYFKGKHSLISHIHTRHIDDTKVKCNICNRQYSNNRNLKRHTESCHSNQRQQEIAYVPRMSISAEKLYQCFNCHKCYSDEHSLRRHVKKRHSYHTYYKFLKRYKSKNLFQCEFCINSYSNVYDLKEHMHSKHDKEYSLSTCYVCFTKFFSKEAIENHRKICKIPKDINTCNHCDKLFTEVSSLQFHLKIFHPQSQIRCSDVTSSNDVKILDESSIFRCAYCKRVYYSDRSLKHHIKLKHTTEKAIECKICGKVCNNKYYLSSHLKSHTNTACSKCDYCNKSFKSKRNIRRHIEFTHLGMQRFKCIECETLFKEKRSLRKHVRIKHPNSKLFPECHLCHKRFECAKSCKIHLKLVHSLNLNTHPCHLCSVSFSSYESLKIHLETKHLAEDEIYKCQHCKLVFRGQEKFEQHNELYHSSLVVNRKILPRCVLCNKDFSTRKTLKRHIKKFHADFDFEDLTSYSGHNFATNCKNCIKSFTDNYHYILYMKTKSNKDSNLFKCEECKASYTVLEYAMQRFRHQHLNKSKTIMSELCVTEMRDGVEDKKINVSVMEPESTTLDVVKLEPPEVMEDGNSS